MTVASDQSAKTGRSLARDCQTDVAGNWLGSTSRRADALAVVALIASVLIGARGLYIEPIQAGLDTFTFFWPMYAFLGEQLRSGNIPGWNPYQFSGVPFAADPESGWMYVPAMVVFGLLPLATAIKVYAVLHILLAGCGTYLYGRVIGLIPAGAIVAAWAVSQGGLFSDRSRCCYTHIQVAAWIPIALLGVELAVRVGRNLPRALAWLLCGVAISQVVAGWVGQGAMYVLLLIGAYVAFRTLLYAPEASGPVRTRLARFAAHGAIPVLLGGGLAAPGLLPRLAYYRESNLAEGYSGSAAWAAELGGWSVGRQLEALLRPSGWFFIGATVLALAVVAVFQSKHRPYVAFFAMVTVVSFVLGLERHTPLHGLVFATIPAFEDMHVHFPERIAIVLQFGAAILAGIGMSALVGRYTMRALAAGAFVTAAGAAAFRVVDLGLTPHGWLALLGATVVVGLLALAAWLRRPGLYRALAALLLAGVAIDLMAGGEQNLRNGSYVEVEAEAITRPNETAAIVLATESAAPPRVFGYDPSYTYVQHEQVTYYRHDFEDPLTVALLVNNRGTLWQFSDLQGYNPLQLQGYVAFFEALNGQPQDYHGSYVLPSGIDSPLLRLLSPDYVIVPLDIPHDRPDLQSLVDRYPQVAATPYVRVLRVTDALPRTWIVHEVRSFDGDPRSLSTGAIDFRRTAFVEGEPPPIEPPSGTGVESATITRYEPDALTVETTSDGDGLLVLSETYAEGWSAEVDGAPVEVIPVNGILRGIPVPGGTHAVTLRFEPPGLRIGMWLGGATALLAAMGVAGAAILDRRRPPRASGGVPPGRPAAGPRG